MSTRIQPPARAADGYCAMDDCCNAWWLRMDMTCDELITISFHWQEPKYPVTLLEKINRPGHEAGCFSKSNRFWTDRTFPDAQEVRNRIRSRIQELGLDDSEAQRALGILRFDR